MLNTLHGLSTADQEDVLLRITDWLLPDPGTGTEREPLTGHRRREGLQYRRQPILGYLLVGCARPGQYTGRGEHQRGAIRLGDGQVDRDADLLVEAARDEERACRNGTTRSD